ncbi:ZP domain-containing protein [Trichonephila clavata]|uniref:ZP domain-containing protein n=1 Tax=Trichonephila clavata TaxID=2740835 RepID=A0A8X6L0T3_TRICU|nr:ZP domain-containing protein [Trichonephila clavata]
MGRGEKMTFKGNFIILLLVLLCSQVWTKEIDSAQDLQQEESVNLPAEHRGDYGAGEYGGNGIVPHGHDPWPGGRPDMAQIKALNVKCEKNHMKVYIEFDRPFYGMIFSKGHYSDPKCVHLPPGTGHLEAKFDIFLGGCGMTSSQGSGYTQPDQSTGLFIENTIIVQYDPQVQEIWDQARRLRCTWYDYYEKAVTFRPFQVDMLDAVTANFLGDNIQCWMQIQVGKGPWASEVAGIVKIGQTMTMVLAIKDEENKFDMLVRNCIAHDGHHQPIQLVDEYGCVVRPKIMSPFQKVKNFGASASVVSYAYFQAFKFPDSMNVHFQCVIQVCRYECPVPQCAGDLGGGYLPAPRDPSYTENKLVSYAGGENHADSNPHQAVLASSDNHDGALDHHADHVHVADKEYGPVFFNRQGDQLPTKGNNIKIGSGYGVSGIGGKPRSIQDHNRKKRQAKDQMTDISTQKVIQVVAPGDVAFSLPSEEKETVVYSSRTDGEGICMSVPSFAVGLVFLLLLLAISTLVAGFLFMRVKHLTAKEDNSISYDNTEFLKVAVPMAH